MDLNEVWNRAKEKFKGRRCKVCKWCDGVACRGEMPGMGGIGTGYSFIANIQSLGLWEIEQRLIHDIEKPDVSYEFLGRKLTCPILVAPVAGVKINMGLDMAEEDFVLSMVRGSLKAGSMAFTADGPSPIFFEAGMAALRATGGLAIPTIKPRDPEIVKSYIKRCRDSGAPAVTVDIDGAGIVHMTRAGLPVGPRPVDVWRMIAAESPIPVILKGVLSVSDARLAAEAGVWGIVVSNHGGRVVDFAPGVASVLPEIAKEVSGRLHILADGGVRSGVDVLKMIALGAEAVLVGRPAAIAAVGAGAEGVALLLETYKDQLRNAMVYTGAANLNSIGSQNIRRSANRYSFGPV